MRLWGDRRGLRGAMLADSVQVGLLGHPAPKSEAAALQLALLTLHGLAAYMDRSLRELGVEAQNPREYRRRMEMVQSHCRNVLASMAAFDEEETP